MKTLKIIILLVLILMSLAAGGAKVMQMPQETDFFAQAGLSAAWLYPLGVLQIISAILTIFPKSRRIGLILLALGLGISSIVIFMTGNVPFAMISLIPAALAVYLAMKQKTTM